MPDPTIGDNDILISNFVDEINTAHGCAGNDIIIGNVNTPSLELLSLQNIEGFEILMRAITDDVLPLDFATQERLQTYGITINPESAADVVALSDLWALSTEKTTQAIDVFTSFQNGVTLELEVWNEEKVVEPGSLTVSERELGKPEEIGIAEAGYTISKVLEQGKYGHVEEIDGKWYYVLDQAIDSGPIAGANAVENADSVTVELRDARGLTQTSTISINIIDDCPEITIAEDSRAIAFYLGADGASISIIANDLAINY